MQLTLFTLYGLPQLWNALSVIDPALDTKVIKYKLTQYLWSNVNHNFSPGNTCTYSFICNCSKCSQLPTVNNYHNLDYNSYNYVISNYSYTYLILWSQASIACGPPVHVPTTTTKHHYHTCMYACSIILEVILLKYNIKLNLKRSIDGHEHMLG